MPPLPCPFHTINVLGCLVRCRAFPLRKAEETRLAIRHGEIRAAKLAAARQMAGSPLMLHDLHSES